MQEISYNKRDKQLLVIVLFLFRLTLDFMYLYIIQKKYVNMGILEMGYSKEAFSFNYDIGRILYSFVACIFFIEILTKFVIRQDKPHELLCVGLVSISLLPNLVMFAYSNIEWRFIFLQSLFWLWFLVIVVWTNKNDEDAIDRDIEENNTLRMFSKQSAIVFFWILSILFIIGSVILSFRYYGGFNISLSFADKDVYECRLAARDSFGTIINYFRNNAMYVVVPLIANIFLINHKYGLFTGCLIVLLLLFSVDSQKAVLMLALLSFFVSLSIKNLISKMLIKGLLFINLFVILIYLATGNLLLIDYLVKRVYFLPAIIGRCYYEYVTSNGNIVLFSSLFQEMNVIQNYEYAEISLPFMIGRYYFGSVAISANTGAFAGAYAYGLLSLIITPLAYAFLFRLLNKFTRNIGAKYYMPFILVTIFVIEGATIPSVLSVYGYITGLILLYLMNNTYLFVFSDHSNIV